MTQVVAWPQGLASHKSKGTSRDPSRIVVKTTGREGGRELEVAPCQGWGSLGLLLRLCPFALALALVTLNQTLDGLLNYGV
uniref:Uncharacterized protein n=1 Tax=Solanum tuberosum TaxID=4113 RepID=M1DU88_SOLTU